jgi:hypothetical protein
MKSMKRRIYQGIISVFLIMMLATGCRQTHKEGEPDVVNSITTNYGETYFVEYMKVVANRDEIEDKAAFASKLVDMYKEDSFETVKFSRDEGYAASLTMAVYLWKDEIEGNDPVMVVEYSSIDNESDCDVVNDPDNYQLLVDGEVVTYEKQ